jgi:hypothetical protein
MTFEEIKATYPANTVYLSYDKSGQLVDALPFDFCVEEKKTYADCCEAMQKKREDLTFTEHQSAELYALAKLYQKRVREASIFGSVKFVIDDVISSLSELKDDIDEIEEDD